MTPSMLHSLHLSVFLMLIFSFSSNAQKPDILGKWYFDRFGGPHGEIAESAEIVKANKLNKGLMITFTKNNKMIYSQPGGMRQNNSIADYQVSYDLRQVICAGDTLRIMLLTSEIL